MRVSRRLALLISSPGSALEGSRDFAAGRDRPGKISGTLPQPRRCRRLSAATHSLKTGSTGNGQPLFSKILGRRKTDSLTSTRQLRSDTDIQPRIRSFPNPLSTGVSSGTIVRGFGDRNSSRLRALLFVLLRFIGGNTYTVELLSLGVASSDVWLL